MDERGWYWHEKARIHLAWLVFKAMDWAAKVVFRLTFRRVNPFHGKQGWSRLGWHWIWWASQCYLIDDLRKHDMPENVRVGGIWR